MGSVDMVEEIVPYSQLEGAWINKGIALDGQGRYDEAIKAYDKAIGLDRHDAKTWNNKGATFAKQGKYDDALQHFEFAIQLDPDYSMAWGNRGTALEKLGRTAEAQAAFAKAKELGYTS